MTKLQNLFSNFFKSQTVKTSLLTIIFVALCAPLFAQTVNVVSTGVYYQNGRRADENDGIVAPGDTIFGGQQIGAMGKAADMIPTIQQMLPKLDSILASVNTLLADPAIASSLHNVDQITANLARTSNDLNQLTAQLNRQMPQMLKNADGVLANTNQITKDLNDLDIAATMSSVNNTLHNVEQMTAKLNSKEGTLGLLMRDPGLYNNLNATMMHADSLMIDLKQNPKRYVHFSVFGKKNK